MAIGGGTAIRLHMDPDPRHIDMISEGLFGKLAGAAAAGADELRCSFTVPRPSFVFGRPFQVACEERQRRQREKEDAWQQEWIKNKREQDRLEKELKHQEEEQQRCHDVQRGSSLERVDQLIDALRAGAEQEAQRRQQEEEERQRKWREQEEQWKKQAEELRREKEKQAFREEQEYLRQKLQEEQRRFWASYAGCREQEQQRQRAEKQRQHEQQRQQQQQEQQPQRGREQQRRDQKQEKAVANQWTYVTLGKVAKADYTPEGLVCDQCAAPGQSSASPGAGSGPAVKVENAEVSEKALQHEEKLPEVSAERVFYDKSLAEGEQAKQEEMLAVLLKKILHDNNLVPKKDFEAVSAFVLGDFMYQEARELQQGLMDLAVKKKLKAKEAKSSECEGAADAAGYEIAGGAMGCASTEAKQPWPSRKPVGGGPATTGSSSASALPPAHAQADGERSRGGFFGRWRAKSEPAKEQSKKKDGPQASAPKGSQWTRWPGADMPRAASTEDKARSAKETAERAAREKMQKAAEHKASSLMDTVMKQIPWEHFTQSPEPESLAAFFDGRLQMDGGAAQVEGAASGEVLGAVAEVQLRGRRLAFVFLHSDGSERVRVVFDRRLFDSSSSELPFPSKSLHAETVRVEVQQSEGKDLFGLRWFRLPLEVSAGSTPGIPERPRRRRPSSSWVCCPLCPATSMRRFSLDRGLRAHLDAAHSEGDQEPKELEEAWHRKIAAMAEARGIFAHRSAEGLGGARRSAFINNQTTTDDRKLAPALEAARTGDVTTLEGLLREVSHWHLLRPCRDWLKRCAKQY
ncbi:Reticulocyte-binding protein 2-like a [Symbiodinium microadriaticum]|uniref:Reticulocyte-binding protein 2-like a n=1 Tax=Symbiodinium microadriaticum TaxID=2951 RepID=A0A1Q9F1A5_SYMMI|nr:Reticulocyte-binding protein 2-like a [Symbiodinium microadriaticum]